jgi:hypothetical protein
MSKNAKAVSGVLGADGITIRLNTRIGLPPGRVSVIVSPEGSPGPSPKPKRPPGLLTPAGEPTARYAAYLKYQERYARAKRELDEAYSAALADPARLHQWPLAGVGLQAAVDSAWQEWVTLGFKNEVEKKLADPE